MKLSKSFIVSFHLIQLLLSYHLINGQSWYNEFGLSDGDYSTIICTGLLCLPDSQSVIVHCADYSPQKKGSRFISLDKEEGAINWSLQTYFDSPYITKDYFIYSDETVRIYRRIRMANTGIYKSEIDLQTGQFIGDSLQNVFPFPFSSLALHQNWTGRFNDKDLFYARHATIEPGSDSYGMKMFEFESGAEPGIISFPGPTNFGPYCDGCTANPIVYLPRAVDDERGETLMEKYYLSQTNSFAQIVDSTEYVRFSFEAELLDSFKATHDSSESVVQLIPHENGYFKFFHQNNGSGVNLVSYDSSFNVLHQTSLHSNDYFDGWVNFLPRENLLVLVHRSYDPNTQSFVSASISTFDTELELLGTAEVGELSNTDWIRILEGHDYGTFYCIGQKITGPTINNTPGVGFVYHGNLNEFVDGGLSVNSSYDYQNNFTISPNPVSNDEIEIFLPDLAGTVELSVFTINGEVVLKEKLESNQSRINLSGNPNGMYILVVNGRSQKIVLSK